MRVTELKNIPHHPMFKDERYIKHARRLAAIRLEETICGLCEQRESDRLEELGVADKDWPRDSRYTHFAEKHFNASHRTSITKYKLDQWIVRNYRDAAKQLGLLKRIRAR